MTIASVVRGGAGSGEKVESLITLHRYADLSAEDKLAAQFAIGMINAQTSTDDGGSTWDKYTLTILYRMVCIPLDQQVIILAKKVDEFVGYAAFYRLPHMVEAYDLGEDRYYCSWSAVHPKARGQGIAMQMKEYLFEDETVRGFCGHIKRTNKANLRVVEKFTEKGYPTTLTDAGRQFFYTTDRRLEVPAGK